MAAQSTATHASESRATHHTAPVPSRAEVLRAVGLAAPLPAANDLDQVQAEVARLLRDVSKLRDFVAVFRVASLSQDRSDGAFAELYWPTLLEGLQRMIPDTSMLEEELPQAFDTLRRLNATASAREGRQAAPAASEGRTKRAELAGDSSRA